MLCPSLILTGFVVLVSDTPINTRYGGGDGNGGWPRDDGGLVTWVCDATRISPPL